ncbi:hypothetical protein [Deinococcus sp. DB0503]|uniref:hypothetical protein n=1 Tax=Deinococcus sp. DB0503 TaxID=2479203 RepID=UPI0018DF1E4F|nr:hypothetical protein [Deinococcus sp. DB0503]MBI0447197.1 hypothetical protein [Deinococcus sp. DB0503]
MTEIPTAREAARRSDEVRMRQNSARRARCLRLLQEAIEGGWRQAVLPAPLPADLERELIEKGYTLGQPYEDTYNEPSVQVRW